MATTGVELATAYVTLAVSTRGMERDIRSQFSRVESQAGVTGTRAGKAMGGGLVAAAKGFALPLAAAFGVGAIVSQINGAVEAGSDFQQAVGGADAVFKKEAAGIKKSAEGAAAALGLSKTEYLELATVLGAGLKNKGVKDYAKQSQSLIKTGADLAAQFGGSTQDAVNALASAMRGETDPIERYGVSLNETAINAKLAADGAKKVNGRYTEQQKTAARLALITQQTADAQGAFARESDTYAGKQSRLSAAWEDIKTQVGTALLPALTDLSDWFLKTGLPAIQKFGKWVKDELWPALKDGWETVRPGFEKAKELILGAFGGDSKGTLEDFGRFLTDDLIPALSEIANVVLPVIAGSIRANIEAMGLIAQGFGKLRDLINGAVGTMLGAFIKVTEGVQSMLEALGRVPGFGWAADAAAAMQGPIDKAKGIKKALEDIPTERKVTVSVAYKSTGSGRFDPYPTGYAPGREHGGPVRKGQPYIVGEKRPELFVPDQNGKILPRVPESTPAPFAASGARGSAADRYMMAGAIADALGSQPLAVDARDVTRAVNFRNSARARG